MDLDMDWKKVLAVVFSVVFLSTGVMAGIVVSNMLVSHNVVAGNGLGLTWTYSAKYGDGYVNFEPNMDTIVNTTYIFGIGVDRVGEDAQVSLDFNMSYASRGSNKTFELAYAINGESSPWVNVSFSGWSSGKVSSSIDIGVVEDFMVISFRLIYLYEGSYDMAFVGHVV